MKLSQNIWEWFTTPTPLISSHKDLVHNLWFIKYQTMRLRYLFSNTCATPDFFLPSITLSPSLPHDTKFILRYALPNPCFLKQLRRVCASVLTFGLTIQQILGMLKQICGGFSLVTSHFKFCVFFFLG